MSKIYADTIETESSNVDITLGAAGDDVLIPSGATLRTNKIADAGANNTYDGTFTHTKGLVFQRGAVGTVKLKDLAVESEYQVERQGTLLVGKYAMGHGILRPEAAVQMIDS